MYLEHYKLDTKPFQITTDSRFLWLGESHKEALAVLKYGIMDNRGLVLLTGDVGIGKTTLINALIDGLGDDVIVSIVPNPDLDLMDFLTFIAKSYGINKNITSKGEFLSYFNEFLKHTFKINKKVLLIIDESQKLRHDILEEIRLLSNIEHGGGKLINIFLVGQNEFNDILWEERNRALRQRITVRYGIHPLSKTDTMDYINHRLKIAGSQTPIFTKDAIREVISFAQGLPRSINVICDRALLTGYVKGAAKISSKIVKECARDLEIPRPAAIKGKQPAQAGPKDGIINPISLLRKTAYASVIIIPAFLAGVFFMGTPPMDLWNRITSMATGGKSGKPIEQPLAIPGQTENERAQQVGVFHMIQDATVVPEKNNELPGDSKDAAVNNAHASQDQRIPSQEKSKTENIPQKIIIYFSHGSNEFSKEALASLDRAALILKHNPGHQASTVGYTDVSGVYSYNKDLSRLRASIVKSYLVGKGVDPGRIECIGMGPDKPRDDNDTPRDKTNSHRVEIVF